MPLQYIEATSDKEVERLKSVYKFTLFSKLPDPNLTLVLINTRQQLGSVREQLEPSAGADVDVFMGFLLRYHYEEGEGRIIDEAWGLPQDIPYPDTLCFKIL